MRYYEKRAGIKEEKNMYSLYYYYTFRWVNPLYRTIIKKIKILKYGFDTSETWNLDYSMAEWIYPRLVHFRENTNSYPHSMTEDEWYKVLDEIIDGIENYLKEVWRSDSLLEQEQLGYEGYKRSMQLITDNLFDLWD